MYAIDTAKPSLAWALTSNAAQICQSLGYHRESSMRNDSHEKRGRKMLLFWYTYVYEKSLSLRFGRASSLPDFDITIPSSLDIIQAPEPFRDMIYCYIRHARVQGRVYELLYSPAALSQAAQSRVDHAQVLAQEVQELIQYSRRLQFEWGQVDEGDHLASRSSLLIAKSILALVLKANEVLFFGTLTLIYRAMPSEATNSFNTECIEAARETMRNHQICMQALFPHCKDKGAGYIHE
jgi:hypothetical protein